MTLNESKTIDASTGSSPNVSKPLIGSSSKETRERSSSASIAPLEERYGLLVSKYQTLEKEVQ